MPADHPIQSCVPKDTCTSDDQPAQTEGNFPSERITETSAHTSVSCLPDLKLVHVDQATWDFFVNVLDQPPENAGLRRLLQAPVPWKQ